jgi:hypothetical protein
MPNNLTPVEKAQWNIDNFEPDEDDVEKLYDEMLDECYAGDLTGIFKYFQPSKVIKEMDPTMYRCGCVDWLDSELRENPERFKGYDELVEALQEAEEYEGTVEWKVIEAAGKLAGSYEGWSADEGEEENEWDVTHSTLGTYKVVIDEDEDVVSCVKV